MTGESQWRFCGWPSFVGSGGSVSKVTNTSKAASARLKIRGSAFQTSPIPEQLDIRGLDLSGAF
jgi:hypothetical protein